MTIVKSKDWILIVSNYQRDNGQPPNDPDEQEAPRFVSSRSGRYISYAGLIERIIEQYHSEQPESDDESSDHNPVEARANIKSVVDYVLAVESVQLAPDELVTLLRQVYAEIYGFGALDDLLQDPEVTTIMIEGTKKLAVRRGAGAELETLEPIFENSSQLQDVLSRLLRLTGAYIRNDVPTIETGLSVYGRRGSISITPPPYTIEYSVDIRLHPADPILLPDMVNSGVFDARTRQILEAIAQSEYGFVIVGDTESGKTTLLNAMLSKIPVVDKLIAVERSGELNLSEGASLRPNWSGAVVEDFGDLIMRALGDQPEILVLDEVRADHPQTIAPLLGDIEPPRLIWAFRGSSEPKRIQVSLGMLARMAQPEASEHAVYMLYKRMPFVIVLKRRRGYLQLSQIGEWKLGDDAETTYYRELLRREGDTWVCSGHKPTHLLSVDDAIWSNG